MVKLLKKLSSRDLTVLGISFVLVVLQVFFDLQLPGYMSEITLLVQSPGDNLDAILTIGVRMVGAALASLILAALVAVLITYVATGFAAELRDRLFNKVLSLSMEDISDFETSSLITRSTNDITQIQIFLIMGTQMLFRSPVMAIWAFARISNSHWAWTGATAAAAILLFLIIGISMALAVPKFKLRQQYTDDLNRITRENLVGLNVIRAFNAEKYQTYKFKETNDNLTDTNLFANRVMAVMHPSLIVIMNFLTLAIYWLGAFIIQSAATGDRLFLFSDMIAFSTYAIQVIISLVMLTAIFALLPAAQVSANRILEVLETKSTILGGDREEGLEGKTGEVRFNAVSFRYPNAEEYTLKDISFEMKRGETLAIIGATGSGKSTLINLIPRFYDATEGEVLVDGVNVKAYQKEELNNKIGFVTQEAFLFSGDVKSNIAYGENGKEEPSPQAITAAARIAQADEFIEELEEGYEADVSQAGSNFSGGQKQRLSLARAIARQPEILIFDDSFSALDFKTDQKLRQALRRELSETSKIIVAQRVGTIKDADQIIVLDEGRVVGKGTHEDLLQNNDTYQQIAYSQLTEEELA